MLLSVKILGRTRPSAPNLADDADGLGQRVSADEGDAQRSSVGVVDLTGLQVKHQSES